MRMMCIKECILRCFLVFLHCMLLPTLIIHDSQRLELSHSMHTRNALMQHHPQPTMKQLNQSQLNCASNILSASKQEIVETSFSSFVLVEAWQTRWILFWNVFQHTEDRSGCRGDYNLSLFPSLSSRSCNTTLTRTVSFATRMRFKG